MIKNSRQKFKYLEKEKSFLVEIKSIFYHFWRAFIEANKKIFLEGESPTLRFLSFWGSFSYKTFSYEKKRVYCRTSIFPRNNYKGVHL